MHRKVRQTIFGSNSCRLLETLEFFAVDRLRECDTKGRPLFFERDTLKDYLLGTLLFAF